MKTLDFTKTVSAINGEPLQEQTAAGFIPVSYAKCAVAALMADAEGDAPVSKLPRFTLAVKIQGATGSIDISIDELKLLQDRSRQVCGTLIAGRLDEFLNAS